MLYRRTLLVSDIHGAWKALEQALQRAGFDSSSDRLIFLGDIVDGWSQITECVEFLSSIPYHDHVLGNHDWWALQWLNDLIKEEKDRDFAWHDFMTWQRQGGDTTADEILSKKSQEVVREYLSKSVPFIELGDDLFVHGGLPKDDDEVSRFDTQDLMWDRQMIVDAVREGPNGDMVRSQYNNVFCGHTPTTLLKIYTSSEPVRVSNVWMLDTGAGYSGKLSVMDYASKEVWQSDPVTELYPGEKAR